MDDWRILLYYPLGLLPSLFFGLRMLIQWFESEKEKRSVVTPLFWKLSLTGNVFQMLHFFVQVQYPFALLQAGSAMLAWRNIDLMGRLTKMSTQVFLCILLSGLVVVTGAFALQCYFVIGEMDWVRTPTKLWDEARVHHHMSWHILGTVGGILFASRFWIQWWQAECSKRSELNQTFWWLSITGSVLSLIYFIVLNDIVSVLQFACGLIPYFRNLILMARRRDQTV